MILYTQARKQTLPPSDLDTVQQLRRFDTHASAAAANDLSNYLQLLANHGSIILVVWADEASGQMTRTFSQQVFDCKYLSCKICFNVLNYVFILFTFNLYCLVNIQQPCHNSNNNNNNNGFA